MRDKRHYLRLLDEYPTGAAFGFSLAAAAVYAVRYGRCENEHRSTDEFAAIARDLKSRYGETLTNSEVRLEMRRAL